MQRYLFFMVQSFFLNLVSFCFSLQGSEFQAHIKGNKHGYLDLRRGRADNQIDCIF